MKRALRIHVVVLAVLAAATAASCATSSGEAIGGQPLFDASSPLTCPSTTTFGTGHTWSELYADYFGNAKRTACSGNGACHGDESQAGAQDSNFVCPLNDKDDCYTSMVSESTALIQTSDPANSPLITQVLRHADGSTGNMPLSPPCAFSTTDLQRITDWVAAGALNDSPSDSGATLPSDAGEASD